MFYALTSIFVVALLATYIISKIIFKEKREKFNLVINKALKISVIVYCTIIFLTILLPDSFVLCYLENELSLTSNERSYAIIRWFSTLSFIILPLAVFFKNRTIRNIAIYFCTIITIVSICFYNTHLEYLTSADGHGLNSIEVINNNLKNFLINPTFRSIILGLTLGLEFIIPVILAIEEKHVFNFKSYKEYINFFLVLIFTLISCIPIYVPQHLFGLSNILFKAWSIPHFIWLILVAVEIVVLYFIFKNKNFEIKRIVCFVLSLSLLIQYFQMFGSITINLTRLPLQLCNLAAFLILFSFISKNQKLFNFTVIVNVVGVLFALAMPDLDGEGLFYLYNMHFIFEHTNVLVIPILALLFKIFNRLDKKALKHYLIGFCIYFVSILILGTIFNAIYLKTQNNFYLIC